ncbi:phosphotransferase enzyme family protein [mine drainage metagenome]|uniref:Phosphotransferase enzyme family protein n=1 Tax=mine drainage metagenome TaxID=410659 RepID=A0A1J5QE21_9ZZZZ
MTVIEMLRGAVEAKLSELPAQGRSRDIARGGKVAGHASISELGRRIADDLVREAFTNGLDVQWEIEGEKASRGSSAMEVGQVIASVSFFYKIDISEKILDEAKLLRRLAQRDDLPLEFRNLFPRVFALSDAGPVFGYLMEQFPAADGFSSVADLLFPSKDPSSITEHTALRVANSVCDTLFTGYDYREHGNKERRKQPNFRLRPSVYVDYVERIRDRMADAALSDAAFKSTEVEVIREGQARRFRPWAEYLEALRAHRQYVDALAPPFVTFVHGDPNPENVLVRAGIRGFDMRLIDPKEWGDGDYLFDLTKFVHYVCVTGPAQSIGETIATANYRGDIVSIELALAPPSWVGAVDAVVRDRAATFARQHGDQHWELRWILGMASNLLGLPANRLAKGQRALALATYASGLSYLHDFCAAAGVLD